MLHPGGTQCMKDIRRTVLLAALLAAGAAMAANADGLPTFILNGYSFGGISGVNTDELAAKFKHKPGARISRADVAADEVILANELRTRGIKGNLFATLAEKHGRVWVIFDLQDPNRPAGHLGKPGRRLEAQEFEGASRISASALAAATGLKTGDLLSPEKVNAARQAILALYGKFMPGQVPSLKGKMQVRPDGRARLTWIIGEPK
jgi:outer membrane protein assembly factor BamA